MPKKVYYVVEGICPKQKGGFKMPFQDQTGPNGSGPLTGRGMGICEGSTRGTRFAFGRRGGRGGRMGGRGFGYNRGYRYNDVDSAELGISLEKEKELLQRRLDAIDKEINK